MPAGHGDRSHALRAVTTWGTLVRRPRHAGEWSTPGQVTRQLRRRASKPLRVDSAPRCHFPRPPGITRRSLASPQVPPRRLRAPPSATACLRPPPCRISGPAAPCRSAKMTSRRRGGHVVVQSIAVEVWQAPMAMAADVDCHGPADDGELARLLRECGGRYGPRG
jgi:hypothetical protein